MAATLAGVATALLACTAFAEIPPFYSLGTRPEKDVYAVGALYFDAPLYAGAEARTRILIPSATMIMASGFFADVISGVGFNFSTDTRFEYGVRVTAGTGREEPARLHGLGKIPRTVNVGGFANYNATDRCQLQSSARYGSGYDRNGLLIDVGTSYDVFKQGPASVTVDVSVSYADRHYMQSFYGVSADQAIASGYSQYSPPAGQQWATAGLSATAPVSKNALAYVSLEYSHLTGYAASSPYVERRDSTAIEATVVFGF